VYNYTHRNLEGVKGKRYYFLIYDLFSDAVNNSRYAAQNGRVIDM
jgi:hypothetical protein